MIDLTLGPVELTIGHMVVVIVFMIGLLCFFIRPTIARQIAGLKLMLQSISLGLILTGWERNDRQLVQSMVVSTLVVEAMVVGLALTMMIRINKHKQPTDVEDLGSPEKDSVGNDE
jgi:NADH:ubiquinone oxidoreductase subunit K